MRGDVGRDGVRHQAGKAFARLNTTTDLGGGNVWCVGCDENHAGFFAAEITEA